ncbi:MAG: sugar phosphate isomerase/epimerase [Alistipes sp.]|nr:sugar phosphate isomerase/epimerase [Alistipes sp.]
MIRISAFADEISPSLDQQIEYLHHAGIHWMEIRIVDGRNVTTLTELEAQAIKARLDAAQIGVSAIASPIGKYRIDEDFEPHLNLLRHTLRLAEIFDTKLIRIFSFYAPEGYEVENHGKVAVEYLRKMVAEVGERDLRLVHENEAKIFGHTAEHCVHLHQEIDSPKFTLAYDPANFVWGESITNPTESCWPKMQPYVSHIHIKDWKLGSTDVGALAGDGDGQVEALIAELAQIHYDGFVTLEPHMSSGGQFGGETLPEQFDETLRRVQGYCKKYALNYE